MLGFTRMWVWIAEWDMLYEELWVAQVKQKSEWVHTKSLSAGFQTAGPKSWKLLLHLPAMVAVSNMTRCVINCADRPSKKSVLWL